MSLCLTSQLIGLEEEELIIGKRIISTNTIIVNVDLASGLKEVKL